MNTWFHRQPLVLLFALVLGLALGAQAKALAFDIVATTPDVGSITRAIAGDRAEVVVLATGTQDPHFVDAQPGLVVDLNQADLVVYCGLELEVGWLPVLLTGSSNPRIQAGQPGHLNCSAAVEHRLEVPEQATREMGDVHPLGNPHYMISPLNGRRAARIIAGRLIELDPAGAEIYTANLREFLVSLDQHMESWQARMEPFRGTAVLTYHRDWSYLAEWLGLQIAGELEPLPGVPPSPGHLAELITRHRNGSVRALLVTPWDPLRTAEEVARQIEIPCLVLPTQPGSLPGTEDYISTLDLLIERLADGLQRSE
ncbi:MAG: zinc ABC transporter substrate-binding protein [Bradymonadales bacterium]|nr:zinc ABC transporter substrate-binding protein [Bradymonadales bacterium]